MVGESLEDLLSAEPCLRSLGLRGSFAPVLSENCLQLRFCMGGRGCRRIHPSMLRGNHLVQPAAQLSLGSDMPGSARPKDPDDRSGLCSGAHRSRNQAPAVPKPGPSAPAPGAQPLLGFRTPPPLPIMVYLVRFLIGLPSQYPRPCLPCLFPLIHPFRHRLRALHLGST